MHTDNHRREKTCCSDRRSSQISSPLMWWNCHDRLDIYEIIACPNCRDMGEIITCLDNWFFSRHDDVIKWKHFPRYWPFVVTGEFFTQRPVTRSFDVFFDLRLNERLSKQSWGWWFETPSLPLWRHINVRARPIFMQDWIMISLIVCEMGSRAFAAVQYDCFKSLRPSDVYMRHGQ